MKIENVSIADLKPLEQNVRSHSPTQLKELVRSYKQFGQTRPLVIDEGNNILVGNGFYMALKGEGVDKIEAYRIKGLSDIQKKKLILSDNRTFSLGIDDFEGITEYINEIVGSGDFEVAGYNEETLREMTRTLGEITKDMDSQGVIDSSEVEAMNKSFESQQNHIQEQVSVSVTAQPDSSPVVSQSQIVAPTIAESTAKPNVDKTIICPSCGEVIHLA